MCGCGKRNQGQTATPARATRTQADDTTYRATATSGEVRDFQSTSSASSWLAAKGGGQVTRL